MLLRVWRSRQHALLQRPRAGWNYGPTSEIQRPAWTLSVPRLFASSDSGSEGEKVAVELREEDLVESFVKGWGKGGQKINKVRNCVLLKHIPTGLHVRCQETRSLDGNRRIARRLLLQKLDDQVNGDLSKRNVKINKLRKKKANRRNKSKQKYANTAGPDSNTSDSEDEEEEEEEEEGENSFDEYDEEDEVDVVEFDEEEHKFRPQKKK